MSSAIDTEHVPELWVGDEPTRVYYSCGHMIFENVPKDGKPHFVRVDRAPYRCPACQINRERELKELAIRARGGI